jgi:hypothetical protein
MWAPHLIAMLGLTLAAGTLGAATMSLDVPPGPRDPGNPFDVTVNATNLFDGRDPLDLLLGFGFNVSLGNPAAIQFVDATVGSGFQQVASVPGADVVAFAFPGIGPGSAEPLELAVLHFRPVAPGSSSIAITSDLTDPNQGLVFLTAPTDALAAEGEVQIVLEPGGWSLLAIGVAGIAGVARRKKLAT